MKALTLWQPWASLMVVGAKQIETRSWATKYRGPLAIHSAARNMPLYLRELCTEEPFMTALRLRRPSRDETALMVMHLIMGVTELPRGKILGVVDLLHCLPVEELPGVEEPERTFGDYSPGRFGWVCANPRRLRTPIAYRGRQGLWNLPDDVLEGPHEWIAEPRRMGPVTSQRGGTGMSAAPDAVTEERE